jgi:hypothetical protein
MTAKKDLKRRIRERQARTGESYVTARTHVLAQAEHPSEDQRPPAISVVELIDASDDAARLGLRCEVLVSSPLASRIDPIRAIEGVRDALIALEHDPQLMTLRDLALFGHSLPRPKRTERECWEDIRRFVQRARVGIGGTTDAGDMLSLHIDGVLVIAQIDVMPYRRPRARRLYLTTVDAEWLFDDALIAAVP